MGVILDAMTVLALGDPANAAMDLAAGTTTFGEIKDSTKTLPDRASATYLDKVATETAKIGVFNSEINKLYDAAKVNSSTNFKNPDESQRMKQARSAAAGSRVALASAAGSALSKASTTAVQAEAAKRTLLGE